MLPLYKALGGTKKYITIGADLGVKGSIDELLEAVQQAIELGSCKIVNIKPGRVGGLTAARDIYDQCKNANLGLWVGGMLESPVGANVCAALASLDGFNYPPDLFPSGRFYKTDMSQPEVTLTPDAQGRPA